MGIIVNGSNFSMAIHIEIIQPIKINEIIADM
jgi:hypothetical protein